MNELFRMKIAYEKFEIETESEEEKSIFIVIWNDIGTENLLCIMAIILCICMLASAKKLFNIIILPQNHRIFLKFF